MKRALAWLASLSPLTGLGALVLGAAWAGWHFVASPRADLVLEVVCAVLLALVGVAWLQVLVASWALRRVMLEPRETPVFRAETDTGPVPVLRFHLPLLSRGVTLAWTWVGWPHVQPLVTVKHGRAEELVDASLRLKLKAVTRRVVVEDALGLARRVMLVPQTLDGRVLPHRGRLNGHALPQVWARGLDAPWPTGEAKGERVDMRQYVRGDPLRLLLWKVYARTGVAMVRAPEQAVDPDVRVTAWLAGGPGDEAAAGMARACVEDGVLGLDWVLGASTSTTTARTVDEAYELLAAPAATSPLTRVGQIAASPGAGTGVLLVFLPANATVAAQLIHDAAAWQGPKAAVVVVDRVEDSTAAVPTRLSWAFESPARPAWESSISEQTLWSILARLHAAGFQAVAVERASGRQFGTALRPQERAA